MKLECIIDNNYQKELVAEERFNKVNNLISNKLETLGAGYVLYGKTSCLKHSTVELEVKAVDNELVNIMRKLREVEGIELVRMKK